jgi:hypothetical protein
LRTNPASKEQSSTSAIRRKSPSVKLSRFILPYRFWVLIPSLRRGRRKSRLGRKFFVPFFCQYDYHFRNSLCNIDLN